MSCCTQYKFPPGPSKLPIIGNLHNVKTTALRHSFWNHRDKFGDLSNVRLGGVDIVVLNSMDALRKLNLSGTLGPALMDRPPGFVRDHTAFSGDILLCDYSEAWGRLRSTVGDALVAIRESAEQRDLQNQEFGKFSDALKENGERSFDPRELIRMTCTNTVMMSLNSKLYDYHHDIFEHFLQLETNGKKLLSTKGRVTLDKLPWLRHCGCCGYGSSFSKMEDARETIMKHFLYDIKESRDLERDGIVYKLLQEQQVTDCIQDMNIEGVITDWYFAGVVSVSSALSFLIYHLLHHPHVQDKVHQEVVKVINWNGPPSVTDLPNLPYIRAVVLESTRITCQAPESVPRCNSDVIEVDDYRLPKGTLFMTNSWRILHDGELWEEPWEFRPERFLDDNGELLPEDHPHMANMIAYGSGARECLGKDYSLSRLALYLVHISQYCHIHNGEMSSDSWLDPRHYIGGSLLTPPPYTIKLRDRSLPQNTGSKPRRMMLCSKGVL